MRRSRGRSVRGVDWVRKGPHVQGLPMGDVYRGMCRRLDFANVTAAREGY